MARHDDYYSLLGIGPDATGSDIDRAYRRAARATHPDINPDDSSAGQRFNAVTIAYQTLSNPERRASYDRAHLDTSPPATVRIVARRHRPRGSAAHIHLGRRPPQTEFLRPAISDPTTPPVERNLFELVAALSRLMNSWPFP